MTVLVLIAVFVIWCLFYSKNIAIGRFIYNANSALEKRLAKLRYLKKTSNGDLKKTSNGELKKTSNGEIFSYLTNHKHEKPIMLLLHGFSADKLIWLKFAKLATKDYHLLIPDLMGHGDVPYDPQQNYCAFEQAKYIERFIQKLGINKPISIVGNSMGAMIGAILAKESKVVTIDTLVLLDPAGAKTDLAVALNREGLNPFKHKNKESAFTFFEQVMHKPPFLPLCVKHYVAQAHYLSKQEQLAHMFKDFFNPLVFLDDTFVPHATKIVLVWGSEDRLLPVSEAAKWEKLLGCTTHLLKNVGHMPMVESPYQTYRLIH